MPPPVVVRRWWSRSWSSMDFCTLRTRYITKNQPITAMISGIISISANTPNTPGAAMANITTRSVVSGLRLIISQIVLKKFIIISALHSKQRKDSENYCKKIRLPTESLIFLLLAVGLLCIKYLRTLYISTSLICRITIMMFNHWVIFSHNYLFRIREILISLSIVLNPRTRYCSCL